MNSTNDSPPDEAPSKSQLKRDAQETFQLGRRLVELPDAQLKALPLDSDVLEAVYFARSIRSHGARKRQLGFLAGLLRRADLEPLEAALHSLDNAARESNARHHRCEAWRDRLLEQGDQALGSLLEQRSDTDAQALRTLIRNAQREAAGAKPPAAARKLFKALRAMDERETLPPA